MIIYNIAKAMPLYLPPGAGRLRWNDDAAIVLQRNKDQWEQEFCLVQGVTSFLWGGADLLKAEVSSLA